jgi:hypothetical protein
VLPQLQQMGGERMIAFLVGFFCGVAAVIIAAVLFAGDD